MPHTSNFTLSVVVPLYNEAEGITLFHENLIKTLHKALGKKYEVIYCDDGSSDGTIEIVRAFAEQNNNVRLVAFSRNFSKENALSAGIAAARGNAVLMLDGDGQHPVERIPDFIRAWQDGAKVVVGLRTQNTREGAVKKVGSKVFHMVFNRLGKNTMLPGSSDFRLIDRAVQQAFLRLPESDRITRGLIDWLGFQRTYIPFKASARQRGDASYSTRRLFGLAANSIVSMTTLPLFLFGYLGLVITTLSLMLGVTVAIEQLLLNDPLGWNFTGTALLSILLIFLVGVVLLSQGIMALYISHIHHQSKRRPLYIIDYEASVNITE